VRGTRPIVVRDHIQGVTTNQMPCKCDAHKLRCIGTTTLSEYRKYIEKDAAFERRFQQVIVAEPSIEDTVSILRGIKSKYEVHHKVRITDAAGRLVYKTTSNGGTATWNGKTMTGAPVATGVYFIWTATNENLTSKDRKVGKVVVVR
jgi:hypothetical protein